MSNIKKYPIRCCECSQKEVYRTTSTEQVRRNRDGRIYELTIENLPITKCRACGEVFFTLDSDEHIEAELQKVIDLERNEN